MAKSKNRRIAELISTNNQIKSAFYDSEQISTSVNKSLTSATGTVTVYSTPSALPTSPASGELAFVTSNSRYYVSNGSGWYTITLINQTPYWITEPSSTYSLSSGNRNFNIAILAGDSDESDVNNIVYSVTISDSDNVVASIVKDSDSGRVFTVQADSDSIDSATAGTASVVFSATDGINTINFPVSISMSFATQAQGSSYGFIAGGESPSTTNAIDRWSFTSDTNATDYGDLSQSRGSILAGFSSTTKGFAAGGHTPQAASNRIDGFPFASASPASNIGTMSSSRYGVAGAQSTTNGYITGGAPTSNDRVDKFPFASEGGVTDVGNYGVALYNHGSASSETDAYAMGGAGPHPSFYNNIRKWSFASEGNAVDNADMTVSRYYVAGSNSSTHGYSANGYMPGFNTTNVIDKFPFASNSNATDVGDLTKATYGAMGSSSTSHGYAVGGYNPSQAHDDIEKYSFSSDGNATDVASLNLRRQYGAGNIVD